jgi:hypothetical protein
VVSITPADEKEGTGRAAGDMLRGESNTCCDGRGSGFLFSIMEIMVLNSLIRTGNAFLRHS